jgi:hypothetical protein
VILRGTLYRFFRGRGSTQRTKENRRSSFLRATGNGSLSDTPLAMGAEQHPTAPSQMSRSGRQSKSHNPVERHSKRSIGEIGRHSNRQFLLAPKNVSHRQPSSGKSKTRPWCVNVLRATLPAVSNSLIRRAVLSAQRELESLQWRASIANAGDRDALLANPDAIELPGSQIDDGRVFVFENDSMILGFAVLLPREDGEAELDRLFVDPGSRRGGVGRVLVEHCAQVA